MQTAIPCLFMRGGTSRGPFFKATDLPADLPTRDKVLLSVMGSPDKRQIDGLGGAHPLTSKVGIVSRGSTPGVDLNFLFAQLQPDKDTVDTTPNCGNMLAAVVPFALETGLVRPKSDTTTLRVLTLNTDMQCDITVQTPNGRVEYEGTSRIDGAPGTSAPITINFLDTAGSVAPGLLPTGNVRDMIDGVEVTCIDNGMPLVMFRAGDVGRTGYENVEQMNADIELKARIERLRIACGHAMKLGDVTAKNYPKMTLIAPPRAGGSICTRITQGIASMPSGNVKKVSVEHPTGEFSVEIEVDPANPQNVTRAALLRTARLLMRGEVMVPGSVWTRQSAVAAAGK
jgi:4-oxalomesaconate tautomerase